MRKFAMTLILALGMATASFAGGVETAEAKAKKAKVPKWDCVTIGTTCAGNQVVCGQTWAIAFANAMALEDQLCGKVGD